MSIYQYKSDADELAIHLAAGRKDACFMSITEKYAEIESGIYIPKVDAPTIAAELLKAAGQESVIVPKAYEEVKQFGDEIACGSGPEAAYGTASQNPNWLYNRAANYVALAQWIEGAAAREAAEKAEAEAAEKKLQERRGEVIGYLGWAGWEYISPSGRKAINRIIELEDGASHD